MKLASKNIHDKRIFWPRELELQRPFRVGNPSSLAHCSLHFLPSFLPSFPFPTESASLTFYLLVNGHRKSPGRPSGHASHRTQAATASIPHHISRCQRAAKVAPRDVTSRASIGRWGHGFLFGKEPVSRWRHENLFGKITMDVA